MRASEGRKPATAVPRIPTAVTARICGSAHELVGAAGAAATGASGGDDGGVGRTAPAKERTRQVDLVGLVAVFVPEREHLRFEPAVSARLLRGLVMATSHPALISDPPLSPRTIVELFLDGARVPAVAPRPEPVASRA